MINVPGYKAKYYGMDVFEIDTAKYFAQKSAKDKENVVWCLKEKQLLVWNGTPIGFLDDAGNIDYTTKTLDDLYPVQMKLWRQLENKPLPKADPQVLQDEASQWVLKELEKLTPKHFVRTYYTTVTMRRRSEVRVCVVPVNVYENNDFGYEIMPIDIIAKNCPWDMMETNISIDTENTHLSGNLHKLVVEDAEVHKHLRWLEES